MKSASTSPAISPFEAERESLHCRQRIHRYAAGENRAGNMVTPHPACGHVDSLASPFVRPCGLWQIPLAVFPNGSSLPIGCGEGIGWAVHADDADKTVSMKSAMTSRETSKYFKPSLPSEMLSFQREAACEPRAFQFKLSASGACDTSQDCALAVCSR
jgi:hypothetical protein